MVRLCGWWPGGHNNTERGKYEGLPVGLKAQLVEHCIGITDAMG